MTETPRWKLKAKGFLVIAGLAAALLLTYGDVVFGGKTLLGSAREAGVFQSGPYGYEEAHPGAKSTCIDARSAGGISEPLAVLTSRLWRAGKFPLWNPHVGLGMPLAANMQSAVYYPLNLGLWLLPRAWVFDATYLLRLFLAGLFTYLFCRCWGLGRGGALAAGIAYMLNGYFARHVNMFHLNVEVLLPLYLYAFERLVRGPSRGNILIAAVAVLVAVLGGAPESAFLALTVAGCYFVVRVIAAAGGRRAKVVGAFALASGLGLLSAGVLLVPAFEYMANSVNFHPPGTGGNAMPAKLILELPIPRLYGRLNDLLIEEDQFFLPAYVGVAALFLAGLSLWGKRLPKHVKYFFAGAALVSAAKAVGVPGVSVMGKLPGFDRMQFYKYGMNVICFSAAFLCGAGFDAVIRREVPARAAMGCLGVIVAIGAAGYVVALGEGVPAYHLLVQVGTYWGIALALGAAVAASVKAISSKIAGAALLVILVGSLASAVPGPHPKRYDPFAEPPFISYLKEQQGPFRTMGEGILYPNLSAGFGIDDIRANDALYPPKYFEVLKRYVAPVMIDRFDGVEDVRHYSPVLDLFNVKYLITARPLEELDSVTFMKQLVVSGRVTGEIEPVAVEAGERKQMEGLAFQPPARLECPFPTPPRGTKLEFSYGVLSAGGISDAGAIVDAAVRMEDREEVIFSERARAGEGWRTVSVELEGGGNELALIFSTRPIAGTMPAKTALFGMHFHYAEEFAKYELAYADEAYVYLNRNALPRTFFVENSIVAEDTEAAFAGLLAGWMDFRREVLLGEEPGDVSPVTANVENPECETVRWDWDSTAVRVRTARSGYVVLSQIYYPGWKAYVDGKRTKLLEADYLLTAAQVPAGEHEVEFRYEPWSFKLGLGASVLGLLGMVAVGVPVRRRGGKGKAGRKAGFSA